MASWNWSLSVSEPSLLTLLPNQRRNRSNNFFLTVFARQSVDNRLPFLLMALTRENQSARPKLVILAILRNQQVTPGTFEGHLKFVVGLKPVAWALGHGVVNRITRRLGDISDDVIGRRERGVNVRF